ncbi:hypothetical protein BC835DRAFT_953157 [Cytidiella melzeri]|nr:hypothetical protein BC835DRAFT_953157 [Cytidiella melzeri]
MRLLANSRGDYLQRHPWILFDMPHGEEWLRQTAIEKGSLAVTEDEASSAVSAVKFRWPRHFARGLYSLIRNVRPQRSFRRPPPPLAATREEDRVGTSSMPHYITRQRSIAIGALDRDKLKHQHRPSQPRNKSSVDVRSQKQAAVPRLASGEEWSRTDAGSCPRSRGQQQPWSVVDDSNGQRSTAGHPTLDMLQIPSPSHAASSSRVSSPHPTASLSDSVYSTVVSATSATRTGPSDAQHGSGGQQERPRSRLSMLTRWWRPGSSVGGAPSSEASTSTLPSGAASPLSPTTSPAVEGPRQSIHVQPWPRDLSSRRSEDAFQPSSHAGGNPAFSIAMRAASWGEVGEYARPTDDRTSIYSGERPDEALDAETFLVGAGGVAQSPVSSVPSGILSTVSSTVSLGPPVLSVAHALLQRVEGSDSPAVSDPAMQDPNVLQRQSQYRSHAVSPLSQSLYGGSQEALSRSSSTFEGFQGSRSSRSGTPSDHGLHPSTSQLYQEEDAETDSEEDLRLEVRTRRPSWSVTDPTNSPPPRGSDILH